MVRKVTPSIEAHMQQLRSKGYSASEIAKKFNIAISTTLRHIAHHPVLPQYQALLFQKRGGSKLRKELKEKKALEEAKLYVGTLTEREKLFFLSALYWAEGSKKDFGLSNTDPKLIKFFIEGLRDVLHISDDRLRVSIRIYEDLDKDTCLEFWSEIVKIPKEKFVNVNILKGKKIGKLQYGMCRIRVSKGEMLLKRIKAINDIIASTCPYSLKG